MARHPGPKAKTAGTAATGKASGAKTRRPAAQRKVDHRDIKTQDEDLDAGREAAKEAGLRYVSDETPGITRKKSGKGWRYVGLDGKTITDYWEKKRIDKIAIPPAYTDVWICPRDNGHILATGRDAKGRKQYRYHPKWTETRDESKYERMVGFAKLLPSLRQRVDKDMRKAGLPREKVLATIVALLDKTLIRVGNEDYARDNKSFGLTTLRNRHLDIEGSTLRFDFKGKSGKTWNVALKDRRVARIVRSIQDLPGQQLFQYIDDEGTKREVSSSDVNDYLRETTGEDITAKDFRTWAGTVLASMALREFERVDSQAGMKKNIKAAIESVAKRLGNTPTICRKCYVHPRVVNAYLDGSLLEDIKQEVEHELCEDAGDLKPEEAALLGLLSRRISHDVKEGRVA